MDTMTYTKKTEGKTTMRFEVTVPTPLFLTYRAQALTALAQNISLPGFRDGHIPEKVIIEHVGEGAVLSEMAERAVTDTYAHILEETKCLAIGRPEVSITELSLEKPFSFSITTEFIPEPKLPDYKKIAQTEYASPLEPSVVEEKEVEEVIRQFAHQALHNEGHAHNHENPEITLDDALASRLSPFKTLAELSENIKKNILAEKERRAIEAKRLSVIKKIAEASTVVIPESIIDKEILSTLQKAKQEVEKSGTTWEAFLTSEEKTEDELRASWKPQIVEDATISLVLSEIARRESLLAKREEIEKEAENLVQYYGGQVSLTQARGYVQEALTNRNVHAFLQNQ
jgi:trigger factor